MTRIAVNDLSTADSRRLGLHDGNCTVAYMNADEATALRDGITAWLDAPRLAARETAEVVAEFEDDDDQRVKLVRTSAGEWGIGVDDDPVLWLSEAAAREWVSNNTNADACELCGTYRDDHDVDEDGIYTCTDERKADCEAACAKKGPTP